MGKYLLWKLKAFVLGNVKRFTLDLAHNPIAPLGAYFPLIPAKTIRVKISGAKGIEIYTQKCPIQYRHLGPILHRRVRGRRPGHDKPVAYKIGQPKCLARGRSNQESGHQGVRGSGALRLIKDQEPNIPKVRLRYLA